MSPGNFKPKIEMGIVTKDMLQALADLGYPKEFRDKIDLNQATTIIEKQIRFSTENKVSGATNPDKEVVAEEKEGGYKIPEYISTQFSKSTFFKIPQKVILTFPLLLSLLQSHNSFKSLTIAKNPIQKPA